MKTKIIPFDFETATKIQAGEIEGRIAARDGIQAGVLSFDGADIILVGTIDDVQCYSKNDINKLINDYSLHIELPKETSKHEFNPFDRVLVREHNSDDWKCDYFSHEQQYDGVCTYYVCSGGEYLHCIPYEGNEDLVGTIDKPNEE